MKDSFWFILHITFSYDGCFKFYFTNIILLFLSKPYFGHTIYKEKKKGGYSIKR